ncbi:MAG: hypothetical protein HGA75_14200 [Thiobacillus sp.]|nr:hypothetical protein [Thiobacillus sp.]
MEAIHRGSGLAERARHVMSHETGKIKILAVDDFYIYLRHHRAKDPALRFAPDSVYETEAGPE